MYDVSGNYNNAINSNLRTVKIDIHITLSDETILYFGDKDILQGSLYINSRCVSGNDFDLGTVYASELRVSIRYSGDISKLQSASVSAKFGLYTSTNLEVLPLGIFKVTEISRNGNYVKLVCMDAVIEFDKKIDTSDLIAYDNREEYKFAKKLCNIPEWCCSKCGLSSAYVSAAKFSDYPNSQTIVNFMRCRSELPTYRDLLSAALELMGCYGFINRLGYFEVAKITNDVVYKTTPYNRNSLTVSDYEINEIITSWKGMTLSDNSYGKAVALDNNIFLDEYDKASSDTYSTVANFSRAINNELKNIKYCPCTIDYMGNPALDVGDMIEVSPIIPSLHQYTYEDLEYITYEELEELSYGQLSDFYAKTFNAIIMQHNWVYRGKSTIYCYGQSSKLRKVYV